MGQYQTIGLVLAIMSLNEKVSVNFLRDVFGVAANVVQGDPTVVSFVEFEHLLAVLC